MSFPRYPTYKDSGVEWLGEVPQHWGVKRFRFVAELNPSKSEISALDRDTVISFLPMEAIGDDGTLNLDKEKMIREVESGYTYFRDGDVTLAKITPCYENGKGALMKDLVNGIGFGTTELIVARPRLDQIIGSYLHYLFISPDFRGIGESHMYGAGGQKRVPDAFVRNFTTAVPPVQEQTQIAAFLDHETAKIDELVAEQRRLMELLKEKRQAVISHAVTQGLNPNAPMKPSGIEWLGDVPAHWQIKRIKHLIAVLTDFTANGSFASLAENVAYRTEGYSRLVRLTDLREALTNDGLFVDESAHQFLGKSELFGGEVLIANVGAYAGYACLMPYTSGKATLGPNMYLIRFKPSMLDNAYGLQCLMSIGVQEQLKVASTSTAQPKLNKDAVKGCVTVIPPTLEEQAAILEYLRARTDELDILTAEAQHGINLLQERRTALISAAVTGQIDIRGHV